MISHIPGELPNHLAILGPFEMEVWGGLFISVLVFAIVFWLFVVGIQKDSRFNLVNCFFHSLKVLVMQSELSVMSPINVNCTLSNMKCFLQALKRWPVQWSPKLLLLSWCIYGLVMDAAYSGALISSLTAPVLPKPIGQSIACEIVESYAHLKEY